MAEKKSKKQIISLIVLCVSIIALSVSFTYAYFVNQMESTEEQELSVKVGTMELTFKDKSAEATPGLNGTWTFGDTIEKELIIENTGTMDAYAKISWENLVNTYLEKSLSYKLEEKIDEVGAIYRLVPTTKKNVPRSETASKFELANGLLIPGGHTYTYKVTINFEDLPDTDQTADLNANFSTKFTIDEGTEPTLASYYVSVEKKKTTPTFTDIAEEDETRDGLYGMVDDSGSMSYYYRGAVANNYVKFGQDKDGNDMYWRIIRFNGDGTVRMQYDGKAPHSDTSYTYTRGFALTNQVWNTNRDDNKYVGYMFGGADGVNSTSKSQAQTNQTPSEIKTALEEWYEDNIEKTNYGEYIADEIFCNDRSIPGTAASGYSFDKATGFGTGSANYTAYGAYARLYHSNTEGFIPTPQFMCPQDNDKFTAGTESGGNRKLSYPVGLITADEIVAAGSGRYGQVNNSYYLYKGSWYWSFSPGTFNGSSASMFGAKSNGSLYVDYLNSSGAVAPVINIKSECLNQFIGDGTANNPYRIVK